MSRSSRYALTVLLFSALIFAGLAISHPRGAGASSLNLERSGAMESDIARAADRLSFNPSGLPLTAPSIDGVSPATVTRSGLLRVTGSGFGAAQGTGHLLIDGKKSAFIAHWSESLILAYVPESASLGDVAVEVTTDGHGRRGCAAVLPVQAD